MTLADSQAPPVASARSDRGQPLLTPRDAPPLLDVRGLTVTYRGDFSESPAVRGISFALARGESLAIVGESGCGKTSVALALMGLLDSRHTRVGGEARLLGRNLFTASADERRRTRGRDMAMIFQDPMSSLNPYLRVGLQMAEPLMEHAGLRRRPAEDAAALLLERVGLPPSAGHLRRYPHEFSGGMCQRAMLGAALACKPALLIADEPTTALDVITQSQVLELLHERVTEEHAGLLLITHDLGIVAQIADRVAVMKDGLIVETGTAEQVFGAPRHEYTRALLAAVPRIDRPRPPRTPAPAAPSVDSSPAGPEALLEVRGLTVRFQAQRPGPWTRGTSVTAVDDVSLVLRRGESLGLVGQSGSGKSSLIRAVLQLTRPDAGQVVYEGRDLCSLSRRELKPVWKDLQTVFQDPAGSLNGRMTVGQILSEPLANFAIGTPRERPERIAELLRRVRLDPSWRNRYPHELSGGQRQRVGIARALACGPKVLFCDEPVSALDVSIQAEIIHLLRTLRDELGLTLFFISHDMAVVRQVADRVAVMHQGRIVEWLESENLIEGATHPYTRELIAAIPIPDPLHRPPRLTRDRQ